VLVILTESIVRSKLLQLNSYSAYHSVLPYLGDGAVVNQRISWQDLLELSICKDFTVILSLL